MASFLSKQKIIQLMCVIHIFPFADPGRGVKIKDSFLFHRAVELKFDADQLPGFRLLRERRRAIHFPRAQWLLQFSLKYC